LDHILSPGWATYLRVSDEDKQTPERSFAMQRQRIQENLLVSSELSLKREYRDMLTGTNPNRADYQQMLADAEAGRFSHLGLYRADRFGRNTVEGLQAATKLISLGIKIRVAHMPSLQPEEPDGFFMFLLQMGMAQREVDVLRQRTADGMEAKLRAGGWAQKAPDGYANKERLVSSNKYDRWVDLHPDNGLVIRQAWELLLTARYTLKQICDELARSGLLRASGKPWAWDDPISHQRKYADNRLHDIFHNPFYAGWVVSKRFGIEMGEVRGLWEPIVTTQEFEQGLEILHRHDIEKSRNKKHFYLLRNLLWLKEGDIHYQMFVSTPSGRSRSYAYYLTHAKLDGKKIHIPCDLIESQIPGWLSGITIDTDLLPGIYNIYQSQLREATEDERSHQLVELKRQLSRLREEEARLGRLVITEQISEQTYNQLRREWQEKQRNIEVNLADLKRETATHLDNLDIALILMTKVSSLFERLADKDRLTLLQILVKRIIVDRQGEIIDSELNSPFEYLRQIADGLQFPNSESHGSGQIRLGAPKTASVP
jgi:DNA invertase Pin-like site-specific DNA recombinase